MLKIFAIMLCAFSFIVLPSPVVAETRVIQQYVSNAQKMGEDRLVYLLWDVYDASFYAPNGTYAKDQPFALKLDYLRFLKGVRIAERSIKEIKGQGFNDQAKLSAWLAEMMEIFPNVNAGDTITGIRDENGHTVFYLNDQNIGYIQDQAFTEHFFDIWLSPKTSQPDMRKKLLGL